MRRAAFYSVLLHIIFVLLIVFGLPWNFKATPPLPQPVPIEVLTLAEETMAPRPSLTPLKEKDKPDEKKPEPKPIPEKPTPPPAREREPDPVSEVKPEPELPKPEVKEEPKTEPEPLPAPKPEPKPEIKESTPAPKPAPPKPKTPEKKPDKKTEKKKKEESFDSILKNLEELEENIEDDTKNSKVSDARPKTRQAGKIDDKLTVSELDLLQSNFGECWHPPSGVQDAEKLAIQIRIWSNPDGTVKDARIEDMKRYNSDSHFRIAAESALRAVKDPRCVKLPLSLDRYESWKELILNFDPKVMLGG